MEYVYTCCNKKIMFTGTKNAYNQKVKQNRKCTICAKIKIDNDETYFKVDNKGRKRKYIDINCKECDKQLTMRYDSYKMTKYKNMCVSCLSKIQPTSFQKTQNGLSSHPVYKSWICMKARCYRETNDNYKWYGGKGVSICEEWKDNFFIFFEWSIKNKWEKGLQIDRIDSNGNYEPSNCQWITQRENVQRIYR